MEDQRFQKIHVNILLDWQAIVCPQDVFAILIEEFPILFAIFS